MSFLTDTEPTQMDLTPPDVAFWRTGNTGVEGVWHFDSNVPGRRVLLTALLHGNEFSGAYTLTRLLDAGLRPRRGSLTLAFCNLAAYDRFDPARPDAARYVEEDMNRVWTPQALADPATLERRRALELLPFVREADWLLDLHSMHERSQPLLLAGTSARHLALATRLRAPQHVVADAGHADGCRLRDFAQFAPEGRRDALSLLLEAGYHFDPAARTASMDVTARLLVLSEVIDRGQLDPGWFAPPAATQTLLSVTDAVVARSMAFRFTDAYTGLETIEHAGTAIGHEGERVIKTPYDRCTLVMPSLRQLRPGVTVVRLAKATPLL